MRMYSTDVRETVNQPKYTPDSYKPVTDSYIPPRKGKTAKDKASGAHGNRFANRAARVAWQHQGSRSRNNKDFPLHTCNGKKSQRLRKH